MHSHPRGSTAGAGREASRGRNSGSILRGYQVRGEASPGTGLSAEPLPPYRGGMLFDVVPLRSAGRRRLRADVLRDLPMRGDVATDDTGARYGLIATLTLAGVVRGRMERVTVARIASSSMVLAGVEVAGDERHVQEWWCRLPAGGPPRAYDPEPPAVVVRDPSYAPV